jgi:peptide/nickel transport system substrate-binding protein
LPGLPPNTADPALNNENGEKLNIIKFHNGDPLTAADVVWTYQDQIDPETAAPTGTFLSSMDTIQALDDYTVQITLKQVDYYFLSILANNVYEGILDQKVVEADRDAYGRNPVGTGPYMFKEWVTADHITLERDPDFAWGPPFMNDQPANIQTIEYRFIPEASTIIAGLEAGEIDALQGEDKLSPTDISSLESTGMFDILQPLYAGLNPYVTLNVTIAPFDDLRVRQALNYAVNKQALMDVVAPNSGAVIQNGPLSSNMDAYWAGIEDMGYPYDLDKAKQLMQDAGYTYNADGMLEKDGVPLSFELWTFPGFDVFTKAAQVIQSQWKDLGVDVQLVQKDLDAGLTAIFAGDYAAAMMSMGGPNSGYLTDMFHSKNIGGVNMSQINRPDLDAILDRMASAVTQDDHLQAVKEAQQMIVEQAYIVPLFNQPTAEVVSKQIKGATIIRGYLCFWSAYFEQ